MSSPSTFPNSSPARRRPARDSLDRTLTVSRFGVNTLGHYFAVILVSCLQLNELEGSRGGHEDIDQSGRASPIWRIRAQPPNRRTFLDRNGGRCSRVRKDPAPRAALSDSANPAGAARQNCDPPRNSADSLAERYRRRIRSKH